MGSEASVSIDELDNDTPGTTKGMVEFIELKDDEYLDYVQMFKAVEWKNDIPSTLHELGNNDQSTYKVIGCLKELSADPSQLKIVSIQSKDELIRALKKNPTFWNDNKRFVEIQLGIIQEDTTAGATADAAARAAENRTDSSNCDCILQ